MLNIIQEFSSDLLNDLAAMIEYDIDRCITGRTGWTESLVNITKNYLGIPDEDRFKPWEGSSDVFIPMTMISVETAHPRILAGVVGTEEMVTASPTDATSVEAAENVTQFLNWAFHSQAQIGAYPVYDRLLHTSELYGRAYSRVGWDKRTKPVVRRYTMPRYQQGAGMLLRIMQKMAKRSISMKRLEVPYQQHLNNILGGRLVSVDALENYEDRASVYFRYYVDGRIREGEAWVPTPELHTTYIHMYVNVEEKVRDAVQMDALELTDMYHPIEDVNLHDAAYVAERYWLDIEELHQMRQDGIVHIEDDDWASIVRTDKMPNWDFEGQYDYNILTAGRESRPHDDAAEAEDQLRTLYARAYGNQQSTDPNQGVECLEYHRTLRLAGKRQDYILYYLPRIRKIVRITYLGVEIPSGRRPYGAWDFMPATDNSGHSMGIGHIVMDLQGILNDIFNKQVDRDDILTMPFGFYRPSTLTKGQKLRLSPGMMIPTNDPTAFNFPNWARPTGADMPYIQSLLGFVERLTNATNYFQGSAPSRPNAPRTFGATAAILQEGNINFNLHIERYQSTQYNQVRDIQELYHHYMPEEMEFMAPGAGSLMKISRDDLRHDYVYIFNSNAENTNPTIRRELSSMVYQSMMMNPLIATNPLAMYNLTRRFALNYGWTSFDKDVPKPSPEMSHAPMTQLEEIEAMRNGQNMAVLPVDNHEQHIADIEAYIQSDHGAAASPELMNMIVAHLQSHQQFAAMMQRMQMLQQSSGMSAGIGSNPAMLAGDQTTQGAPNAVT